MPVLGGTFAVGGLLCPLRYLRVDGVWNCAEQAEGMNLTAFQKLRSGLRRHGAPLAGRDLLSFELRLRTALEEVGVFADVEVERTPDQDRLLVALCSYRGELTEDEVAWTLEDLWADLGHGHWSAHGFLTDRGHVELQAGSLSGVAGAYLTVHLVAQAQALPAQHARFDAPVAVPA